MARAESDLEASLAYYIRILAPELMPYCKRDYAFMAPDRKFEIDFAFPYFHVGVECQGWGHKTSEKYNVDLEKLNFAASKGWRILFVTTKMLRDNPDEFIKRLTESIAFGGGGPVGKIGSHLKEVVCNECGVDIGIERFRGMRMCERCGREYHNQATQRYYKRSGREGKRHGGRVSQSA